MPVLAFPAPRPVQPQRAAEPKTRTADPDDLARALAALREAERHGTSRPSDRAAQSRKTEPGRDWQDGDWKDGDWKDGDWQEDSFSPIGEPKPRTRAQPKPQRRAGPSGDSDDAPHAPGQSTGQSTGHSTGQSTPDGGPDTPRDPLKRRILSLYLPNFAMERYQRDATRRGEALPEDLPQALATEGRHGPVIHAANRAAELAGVHAGARVVDMRALVPTLKVEYADTGADRAALGRLMLWARRWCPWTALDGLGGDGSAGLVMDTTGSDHLWGGEAALLRDIEGRLAGIGLSSRLAIAPTQGAAWALARLGGVREVCTAQGLELRMAPMPVRALRLDADTVLLLKRLGLKTVGEVAAVPRLSLARRFSRAALEANPLLRVDQMMGRLGEPVSAPDDPPRFAVQAALAEPVQDPTAHLSGLCAELCAAMAGAGFGARRIGLTVYRSDGEVSSLEAATSQASRDPGHLVRLLEGKLDRIDPGFGFDLITLSATVAERITVTQTRLDGAVDTGPELARLIDRLSARFGSGTLRRPALRASHIPERREVWAPAMAGAPRRPEPAMHPRPGRLLEPAEEVHVIYAVPEGPPAQFVWRKQTHRVTRFAGPERIAPEWWADRPGTRLRDYYRVEDQYGRRFWIFREGVQEDGRGGAPRWCVHGVFA